VREGSCRGLEGPPTLPDRPQPCGIWSKRLTATSFSDNPIRLPTITATDAARRFAALLDGVEHRGERHTIVRRGKAVAHLEPVATGRGAELKSILCRHRPDAAWSHDLARVRNLLEIEDRE
jgi:antitoxin (DNA-binding transcriptional repressor) of toxin-antitoxin stability system